MKYLRDGRTILSVGSTTVLVHGESISGRQGVWLIKRQKRIFYTEPVIRERNLTSKELLAIVKDIG